MAALPISNSRHVAVAEGDATRVVAVADLAASLGAEALIRLHEADFAALAAVGRDLVHFNLERTINRAGTRYALVPIVRPGRRRPGGPEELPVLDPTRFRTGLCVAVRQGVPVAEVPRRCSRSRCRRSGMPTPSRRPWCAATPSCFPISARPRSSGGAARSRGCGSTGPDKIPRAARKSTEAVPARRRPGSSSRSMTFPDRSSTTE